MLPPSRNPACNRAGKVSGEVAERSKAAVLKTVEGQPSQGSNPCLSATFVAALPGGFFISSCGTQHALGMAACLYFQN